jgi:hypothetical protein
LPNTRLPTPLATKTERAYRRGTAFEKRRRMLEAWASYCAKVSNVLQLEQA